MSLKLPQLERIVCIHHGSIKGRWRTRIEIFFLRRMLECRRCLAVEKMQRGIALTMLPTKMHMNVTIGRERSVFKVFPYCAKRY